MGIFDTLKNAILGSHLHQGAVPASPTAQAAPTAGPGTASSSPRPPAGPQSAGPQAAQPPQGATGSPGSGGPVDIESVLNQRATQKHEKLNWQTSIVDLMKLVDLEPSLENRKALAHELGFTGDTHDTAQMNVWLHKEVMQRLAASGGKVPDSLRH
jgi:uncharacterized protein DUF3597